ncbi:hypothetical protein AB1Y20_007839 [Prymnesium parvum]|uniref:TH1 domain-containing protein n=1 Tax=Prymnesium parvum TaxID=97485 RepID=A0AB34IW27_PRYPA
MSRIDGASKQQLELEASIHSARKDKRWVEASVDLERWLALSKAIYLAETAELATSVAPSSGLVGKFFTAKPARPASFSADDEELRKLVPKVQKVVEKAHPSERVLFVAFVNKHNAHGKVQARLLVVTGAALYNFDHGGAKLKRRIALAAVGSVSAHDSTGQFVLHVPSEYDYHFSAPSHGYAVSQESAIAATPLAGVIEALQQAYATTMGGSAESPNFLAVRNITSESDLTRHVQKKGQSTVDGVRWTAQNTQMDDDSETD